MTEQVSATELFRAAYENRYTWDKSFPGYTADVVLTQGSEKFTGTIQVNPNLSATVNGIDNVEASKSIEGQLREVAIHRIRRTFEETHSKNTFEYGDTDETGAIEILIGGKASGDKYKLRNNEVCLVHRQIHGIVVTINTFSSHETGAGYLSHRYDSIYADPATGEAKGGKSIFTDSYEQVGGYFLLSERSIEAEDGSEKTVFAFSNMKTLPVAVPAATAAV
jgi:Protein of unknown function (DUF3386)